MRSLHQIHIKEEIKTLLSDDPTLLPIVLEAVVEAQEDFIKAVEKQRNCEASNALLEVISIANDPKAFKKFSASQREALVKHTKAYHYPNGLTNHAECERQFYKDYIEKK